MNRFEEFALASGVLHSEIKNNVPTVALMRASWNAALASQWRPMSEKPEKDGWYLVWFTDTPGLQLYSEGKWGDAENGTHWMEVPKV